MKWLYNVLSWHLTCLAVALVILSVLAMPTQGVRADNPSSYGYGSEYCEGNEPPEFCPGFHCLYGDGGDAGCCCSPTCGCN